MSLAAPSAGRFRVWLTLGIGATSTALLTGLILWAHLRYGKYLAASSLPAAALFALVLLALINGLVGRVWPRLALTRAEMAVVFSMLLIAAPLPQASVVETVISYLAPPPGSRYGDAPPSLFPLLRVSDADAVTQFWEGFGTGGGAIPWHVWRGPLAWWGVWVCLIILALHALSRLIAPRWIASERVNFPLMEVPLEILAPPPVPLWRRGLFWIGFAVPATMIVLQEMHTWYPAWPDVQQGPTLEFNSFTDLPWSALNGFTLCLSPVVIGIGYLLTSEVAVSIWLFHLLFWAQVIFWASVGYPPGQSAPGGFNPRAWIEATEFGAALALSGILLRDALRRRAGDLPLPLGAIVTFGIANVLALAWAKISGLPPVPAALFLFLLYGLSISLARLVSAGGLFLVDNAMFPQTVWYALAGTALPPGQMPQSSHFALAGQEAVWGRADMSPLYYATAEARLHQATVVGAPPGWARTLALGLAVLVALGVGAYVTLTLGYRHGAFGFEVWPLEGRVNQVFDRLYAATSVPQGPSAWGWAGIAAGIGIGLGLTFLNRRFLWWAVSPLGYIVASTWNTTHYVWSSIFIGWMAASVCKRWGGVTLYRSLRPLFLGLIVGEVVMFCVMALVAIWVGG